MRPALIALLALVLSLVACSSPRPARSFEWNRIVYADAELGDVALGHLVEAVDDWTSHTPVRIALVVVPHSDAIDAAERREPGTHVFFAMHGKGDQTCPTPELETLGAEEGARTWPYPAIDDEAEVTCFDAVGVESVDGVVPGQSYGRGAFAHEIGHGLGLRHTGAGTLMYWQGGPDMPDHLTCGDLWQLHDVSDGEFVPGCARPGGI